MASPPPSPLPALPVIKDEESEELEETEEIKEVKEIQPVAGLSSDSVTSTTTLPVSVEPASTDEKYSPPSYPRRGAAKMTPGSTSDSWASGSTLAGASNTRERPRYQPGLSSAEARLRVLQLKRDMQAAGKEMPKRSNAGMFKNACSTDLLFLIDTTSSMTRHIDAAKQQVRAIVDDIERAFFNEAQVRIAVVGYKDHCDSVSIQFLDFTTADRVRSFLNELSASGGGDAPEDVLGGLRQALNATWKQQTRCIIHIADAPAHGRNLQNEPQLVASKPIPGTEKYGEPPKFYETELGDTYPTPGTEPHGLTHEPLLNQMINMNINYCLLRINHLTDRMAFVFYEAYAEGFADCSLLSKNRYYLKSQEIYPGGTNSKNTAKAKLVFQEAELGTSFSALQHLVVKMVTTSASRTAVRMSAARSSTTGGKKNSKLGLGAITEDGITEDDTSLETALPQWDTPGWLDETLVVEGFSPDVLVHNATTLNDMMNSDDNIMMGIMELTIQKRSRPFAEGALRCAAYARTSASSNKFVVKSFKKGGKRLAHLAEDMRCQALCKAFALEFNAFSGDTPEIDFLVTTCLKGKDEVMSLEPFISGTYVKYNNNCGYVNEEATEDIFNQTAQAFSHFTFERSQGRFLVSDLQGVGHLLTDPAIHTVDPVRFQLADTNLGKEGFKFFFATHVCNDICRKLELKSTGRMIKTGKYDFRKKWPSMENTVCCSNKLCGKIVRLTGAKKWEAFPGHWCDACWLHLILPKEKYICDAGDEKHEFEASLFFWESQGRRPPTKCPAHMEEDVVTIGSGGTVVPGTVFQKSNFWDKLKIAACFRPNVRE